MLCVGGRTATDSDLLENTTEWLEFLLTLACTACSLNIYTLVALYTLSYLYTSSLNILHVH